jgi:predicted transcriptional regulator of viral defense system
MAGDIHRTAELRAAGYTADEVRRMLRSGVVISVRRGVYVDGAPPDDAAARHALLTRAAVGELDGAAVVSHVSAAVLHGLPVWGLPLDVVQVTRNRRRTGARCGTRVHMHSAPLAADETVVVDGVPCTSMARTVVDVARAAPFETAVVSADAALRCGLDRAALGEALLRARGWQGVPAARRVAAFADGRSESVGESRSRVAITLAGLPAPTLQFPVRCGRSTAYTDFGWERQRTVGEFDGKAKYGRPGEPGRGAGEAVYAEKLREDAIRAEGWEVVRWRWADLHDFAPTAARIRERFRTI